MSVFSSEDKSTQSTYCLKYQQAAPFLPRATFTPFGDNPPPKLCLFVCLINRCFRTISSQFLNMYSERQRPMVAKEGGCIGFRCVSVLTICYLSFEKNLSEGASEWAKNFRVKSSWNCLMYCGRKDQELSTGTLTIGPLVSTLEREFVNKNAPCLCFPIMIESLMLSEQGMH